jgi:hypothetical protein
LDDEKKYPAMDLLRVLLFNEKNLKEVMESKIVFSLLEKYHKTTQSKGFKLILFRILSNLFSTKIGTQYLLDSQIIELVVDSAVQSMNETVRFPNIFFFFLIFFFWKEIYTLMGASSFAYNLTFNLSYDKHCDQVIQMTSCLVDKINEISETSDLYSNVCLLYIVSLGNLVYQNQENVSLVNTLQVNLQKFQSSKVEKIRQAVSEVLKILSN